MQRPGLEGQGEKESGRARRVAARTLARSGRFAGSAGRRACGTAATRRALEGAAVGGTFTLQGSVLGEGEGRSAVGF